MTVEEINRLIDRYLEGLTSPEEEQRLAVEVNRTDAPQEWMIIREMLGELTLGEAIYDEVVKTRRRRHLWHYGGWGIAASLALLLAVGALLPKDSAESRVGEKMVAETLLQDEKETKPETTVAPIVEEMEKVGVEQTEEEERPAVVRPTATLAQVAKEEAPVEEAEETAEKTFSLEDLKAQVSEADLAQVEKNFEQWQLRQTILHESIELQIAIKELERKYESYLAENVIEI